MQRVVVTERGDVAMVARGGCVATLGVARDPAGDFDEMRVRCPRPERIAAWFAEVDTILASVPVVRLAGDDEDDADDGLPGAELVTSAGALLKVVRPTDARRLLGEVRAFSAELGAVETPAPGPATRAGWQMMHAHGPAHVLLAGQPTSGLFDARLSTTGQYLCEYVVSAGGGALRASKSGWIPSDRAELAIDEVLEPFRATGPDDRPKETYAAAVSAAGGERRANVASTAEVLMRFAPLKEALGDACLPELEPPPSPGL